MNRRLVGFVAAALWAIMMSPRVIASVDAAGLRCEYQENPLGIDVVKPRLSWMLVSKERAQVQSAYRILVASDAERLKRDVGDLWDSGKVASGESIQIPYDGKPLGSNHACWWKVRVWDGIGKASGWSKAASWTMGLLSRADWKGTWIGCDIPREKVENPTYLPSPMVRKAFETRGSVKRALVHVTAAGLYELYVDGARVGRDHLTPGWTEYQKRAYYQTYDVTRLLNSGGKHVVAAMLGDGWYGLHHNGRGRLALLAQIHVNYADGSSEVVATDGSWKCSYEGPVRNDDIYNGESYDARREIRGWSAVGFDDAGWKPVRVGFAEAAATSGTADVTEKVRAAMKDDALSVGVSNDAFGDPAYGYVKSMNVTYVQGGRTRRKLAREGETLRIDAAGPLRITKATYGADVTSGTVTEARIQAHPGSPVRKTGEIKPVKVAEPKPGVYVYDLGQNFSGWARLRTSGKAGQRVTLRFAEMLNPDGTIYVTNLRAAKCTDTYVCRGGGAETWEPRFTFHGFRYVEMTGVDSKPSLDSITGVVLHSDAPLTSAWESSNPLLNKLFKNIVWGQRSNYLEVPTDCPQRDERMGWSGDAQVFIGSGAYNMDVAPFFTAWMNTFNDSQDAAGGYPNVSPKGGGVSPAWGDAGIICPWTLYRMYGDKQVIIDHWDGMTRWIEYLKSRSKDLVRPAEGFGDWLNLRAEMPKDVISTAYFAHVTQLMAEMAEVVGKSDEAATYRQLFGEIRDAYNRAFVREDGRIKGDTQTTYLMALGFDLLPAEKRALAVNRLLVLFKERNYHISTGFLGVNLLLPVLTDNGHPDLAWKLFTNSDYPGWLYSVTQGATTIWERWDGWTQDRGFQDPGMNSFNHYAYGSCGQWMFATAAGIDTDGPAFRRIVVRPLVGGGIDHLKSQYESIRGRIATEWSAVPDGFRLDVTVPANTTAMVYIPAKDAASVTEGGKAASSAQGVKFVKIEGDRAVFECGSGVYRFWAGQ